MQNNTRAQLTFRYRQCRRPLISQNVQTNAAIGVDVWVVDLGGEADFGRLEGVIGGESNRKEKNASCIRRVTLLWNSESRIMSETISNLRVP